MAGGRIARVARLRSMRGPRLSLRGSEFDADCGTLSRGRFPSRAVPVDLKSREGFPARVKNPPSLSPSRLSWHADCTLTPVRFALALLLITGRIAGAAALVAVP